MIERYTLPEMGAIWTEEAKMRAWLDVEIAAVKAWHKLGKVPREAVAEIEAKADFDVARVAEIEATTNHDVIAFLTNVAEYVGDSSNCLLYTSDAADDLLCVDLGGRRIIKKKKQQTNTIVTPIVMIVPREMETSIVT